MLNVQEVFDIPAMAAFMRMPEIYWASADALMPPPEMMAIEQHLLKPEVFTISCQWDQMIVGYVQFMKRTMVGAEIHVGFHPQARGRVAKAFIQDAIHRAFTAKGLLKLWAIIPSDNRRAVLLARAIGFEPEGRLRRAIVRGGQICQDCPPNLYDLIILGMSK